MGLPWYARPQCQRYVLQASKREKILPIAQRDVAWYASPQRSVLQICQREKI